MSEAPNDTGHASPDPAADGGAGRRVRWWVLLGLVLAAAVVAGVLATGGGGGSGSSDAALAVPVTTADGDRADLAGLRDGRPMVVNFFASWCPPCRAEMPELEQVHRDVGSEVRFVGVSVDYDVTTWRSLVAESGITFETVFEPTQDLLRAVGGKGMPTTVLLTGDGEIAHVHTGALDAPALHALIDRELA